MQRKVIKMSEAEFCDDWDCYLARVEFEDAMCEKYEGKCELCPCNRSCHDTLFGVSKEEGY